MDRELTQHEEVKTYFNSAAEDWLKQATGGYKTMVNTIVQRNDYVLDVMKSAGPGAKLLDVGCGTGELVHAAHERGINAVGVDFSESMIDIANKTASEKGLPENIFHATSIFEFETEVGSLNGISANGFIEYISYGDLNKFLAWSDEALKDNGRLILHARNRLFNLFSLNKFTEEEIKEHNVERMLSEACYWASQKEVPPVSEINTVPLQPESFVHPNTGIDVRTRFQFTPFQLMQILDRAGFKVKELFPIHIHSMIPSLANELAQTHYGFSNHLQEQAVKHWGFIPNSSSFMLTAVKK